jgi:hypothetical protein
MFALASACKRSEPVAPLESTFTATDNAAFDSGRVHASRIPLSETAPGKPRAVNTTSPVADAVVIRWRVFEESKSGSHRFELATSFNGLEKIIALAPVSQLDPWIHNSFCEGSITLEGTQVGKVTMPQTSERGYVVRKAKPNLLTLFGWSKEADPCMTPEGPGTCPVTEKSIASFPIGEGATVAQQFVLSSKSGAETLLFCKEGTEPVPGLSKVISSKAKDAAAP